MFELPPIAYYFKVEFLAQINSIRQRTIVADTSIHDNNSSIDLRFQKVSGLRVNMSPFTVEEGGQNQFSHRLPTRYEYNNLILERGLVRTESGLNTLFTDAMNTFRFKTTNALITLLNENDAPVMGWVFLNAYPVSWASSDLNADENKIMIDTLELAYSRYYRISL